MRGTRLLALFGAVALGACVYDLDFYTLRGSGGNGGTASIGGSGGAAMCTVQQPPVACYDGPPGTEGVGLCNAGIVTCAAPEMPGVCVGQVLPTAETCAGPADEDCNGLECAEWVRVWGDSASQEALAVALDPFGNAIVVGQFSGTMKLDATHTLVGDAEGDGFVVSLTPGGAVLWALAISGPQRQTVSAVATDSNGNVVIGGYTQSTVPSFAVPLGTVTIPPGLFTAELRSNGEGMLLNPIGGSDGSVLADIAPGGQVYGGAFVGTINLGWGPVTSNGTGTNAFLGFLSGAGCINQTWGDGEGQGQSIRGVRTDSEGYTWVAGANSGAMTVGDGPEVTLSASQGGSSVYVIKLVDTLMGCSVVWSADLGVNDSTQICTGLDVDATGNVLVGGQYTGNVIIKGVLDTATSSGTALFAATYDVNGGIDWSASFANGPGEVHAAFDANGDTVLAGGFYGHLDLGGAAVSNNGTDEAIFVGKVHSTTLWTPLWLNTYGNPGEKVAHAVAATGSGESVVVGIANGVLNIGGIPIQTAGGGDVFVARFAP